MDGVLLDTERIYFTCWQQAALEFGFVMKPRHCLAVRSCTAKFAEPYLKSVMGEEFDYITIRDRRRALVSEYIAKYGIHQKPGVKELLTYCKDHNILTAVATATAKNLAEERLELAGLGGMFSHIVGGNQISKGKPESQIYTVSCEQLGLEPAECIAVEDSPNGVISAFGAGCKVIMVPDQTEPEECLKPLLFGIAKDLTEIIPLLEQ